MAKESFRWEPEIVADMTTQAITDRLKELVPAFDLNSFMSDTTDTTHFNADNCS